MTRNEAVRAGCAAAIVIVVLLMPLLVSGNRYLTSVMALAAIDVLMVCSLRTIFLVDQISLGHVGFALIGSYTSALLMMRAKLSFWLSMMAGGIVSGIVALTLGYPFLRVKGIYFAILTLLTAETFRLVAYYWKDVTGGSTGLVGIPAPEPVTLPAIGAVGFDDINNYYYVVVTVVVLGLWILYLIERSRVGFVWRAIRDADELASSVGINVMWYKILSFAIGSFLAGLSGALFAHYQHNLSADVTSRFGIFTSIYLLVYMIVGGYKSFAGPIVGTLILTLVSELARPMKEYQPMILGSIAIIVMLFMPSGLAGLPDQIRLWFAHRRTTSQVRAGAPGHM